MSLLDGLNYKPPVFVMSTWDIFVAKPIKPTLKPWILQAMNVKKKSGKMINPMGVSDMQKPRSKHEEL